MNPATLEEALDLFNFYLLEISKYQNISLVVCPPFVYLEELAKQLVIRNQKLATSLLGAQDTFWERSGPYTGEISTDMLKNLDVSHVLIGHSDRRYKIDETDDVINKKVKAALEANFVPILLVGERDKQKNRKEIIENQLALDLAGLKADEITRIIIAYEPVWAISTTPGAESNSPESTLQAIQIINEFLTRRYTVSSASCLYGGSVNSKNITDFLKHKEIYGAVIGGASLRKEEFGEILKIAETLADSS